MTSTVCTRFGPTLKVGLGLASRCFETQLSYAFVALMCSFSGSTQGVKADMMSMLPVKRSHQACWPICTHHDGFFGRDFSHRWPYKIEEDVAGALGQLRFDVISKQYNKRTALLQALAANPTTYD